MKDSSKDARIVMSVGESSITVYRQEDDGQTIARVAIAIRRLQSDLGLCPPFCVNFHVVGSEGKGVRLRIADESRKTLSHVARTALKNLGLMEFGAAVK